MCEFMIGDIVGRKSYGCDIFFKVTNIKNEGPEDSENILTLKGISYRIEADAPESDLELQPEHKVNEYRDKSMIVAERNTRDIHSSHYRGYTLQRIPKKNIL